MVQFWRRALLAVALLQATATSFAEEPSRYELQLGADISYVSADGYASWIEGGAGKLRYDADNDGLLLTRAFADFGLRVTDTLRLELAAEIYDDFGPAAGLTEATVEWRPLNLSANRWRLKLGEFYPRISLENSAPGWGSPYSITPSAINTWLGEEIRLRGAELSMSRRPLTLGGAHTVSFNAAVFEANDPVGTLMSWKGWSAHDRQSRMGDELPLPPVPQIEPGGFFAHQDPYTKPFLEIDDAAGYYVSAEWAVAGRWLLRASRYDNRADPVSEIAGQFGWLTRFNHLGLQATLPGDLGLISQWMKGDTTWGRTPTGERGVYADYSSYFVLLSKTFSRHRLTARYDRFDVNDKDQFPQDNNAETGSIRTLAYQFAAARYLTIAAEWLQIRTWRPAFEYFGLQQSVTERQFQLSAQLRFDSSKQ
jgi:hypothetical protein